MSSEFNDEAPRVRSQGSVLDLSLCVLLNKSMVEWRIADSVIVLGLNSGLIWLVSKLPLLYDLAQRWLLLHARSIVGVRSIMNWSAGEQSCANLRRCISRIKKEALSPQPQTPPPPPLSSCGLTVMTLLSGWHFLGSFSLTLGVTWRAEDTRVLWVAMTMPQEMQRGRGEREGRRETGRQRYAKGGMCERVGIKPDRWKDETNGGLGFNGRGFHARTCFTDF